MFGEKERNPADDFVLALRFIAIKCQHDYLNCQTALGLCQRLCLTRHKTIGIASVAEKPIYRFGVIWLKENPAVHQLMEEYGRPLSSTIIIRCELLIEENFRHLSKVERL
jgi:hypothetical protein